MRMHARARGFCKNRRGWAWCWWERVGLVGNAVELALVAPDLCSWGACGGGGDVRGQLRQRAGVEGPAALAVSFGALGCSGFIPGSPRLGG